jgi:EmrB/QacA subfamily drug resistance transporter
LLVSHILVSMNTSQRLILGIAILASAVAILDGTIVNVALPAIGRELGGGLSAQQWVVNAYLITLSACILLAGSLSDLFGRIKILRWGLIGFGIASLLCAIAPNTLSLIVARGIQGVAAALLVPSSLALIIDTFKGKAQGQAIGRWTAATSVSVILGPLLGGLLVDAGSWRFVFAINVIPIALALWLMRLMPRGDKTSSASVDIRGAALCTAGLLLTTYALVEQGHLGWSHPFIWLSGVFGLTLLAAFVWYERRTASPMLPLKLFAIRNFAAGNLATLAVYAGLSLATFVLVIFLQQVAGYSATQAGLVLLPASLMMIALSGRFGALAGKFGPRLFMTLGPIVAGIGFLTMVRVGSPVAFWSELFPGVLLFGLGLSTTVAPLTAAVLGDVDTAHAGIASAINNAVARIAGLLAIAAAGLIVGSAISLEGFHHGVIAMAILLIGGGVVSYIGIRNPKPGTARG